MNNDDGNYELNRLNIKIMYTIKVQRKYESLTISISRSSIFYNFWFILLYFDVLSIRMECNRVLAAIKFCLYLIASHEFFLLLFVMHEYLQNFKIGNFNLDYKKLEEVLSFIIKSKVVQKLSLSHKFE